MTLNDGEEMNDGFPDEPVMAEQFNDEKKEGVSSNV